jgi:hypothetical protein
VQASQEWVRAYVTSLVLREILPYSAETVLDFAETVDGEYETGSF